MLSSLFARKSSILRPDVMVIGGGPGGYVAGIRAGQLGLDTLVVEKNPLMGGICLREGCIPSKYLLNLSHKVEEANTQFRQKGLLIPGKVTSNIPTIQKRKVGIISGLSKGIEHLLKQNGTGLIHGAAFIHDKNHVQVTKSDGSVVDVEPKNIILATGCSPIVPKNIEVDNENVVLSRGALDFKEAPKHLVVIGGGVIGLELGSIWNGFGSKVTIIEQSAIVGGYGTDRAASKILIDQMRRRNIDFLLKTRVESVEKTAKGCIVHVTGEKPIECDKVLVSIGRHPNYTGFGFENLNLALNKSSNTVKVDDRFETNVPGVYAIGDILEGPQLAHKASEEGIACVEAIKGLPFSTFRKDAIPSVIYTHPEVASVGLTEEEARAKKIPHRIGKFPYIANSRARAMQDTAGFVKFVCDPDGTVRGMYVVGANAGDAIVEGTLAVKNRLNISAISHTIHPHPTLSEAVMEAAKLVTGKAIHI